MWKQELLYVKRNQQGVIIGLSEKPPEKEDFIPTAPRVTKKVGD